jgi:peroxiredoxin
MTLFEPSYVALWLLVIAQSLILLGVVRTIYELKNSLGGHSLNSDERWRGRDVPAFTTLDISGGLIDSAKFRDHLTALLFVSPTCKSCTATLDEVKALGARTNGNVVVLCRADHDECVGLAEDAELNVPFVVDEGLEISRLFDVSSVPTAVLIDEDGRIQRYGHPMRGEELLGVIDEPDARVERAEVGAAR